MCLVALAIDQSRRFPLVLAANRDEFFERPSARLDWWAAGADGAPALLAGRDLKAGGTWLGLSSAGRLAVITNVRDPSRHDPQAPSRGDVVPLWLQGRLSTDRFWTQTALSGHNGFNLIAADFSADECFFATNQGALPHRLGPGIYGLSNASLDTPWPKVGTLKFRLRTALNRHAGVDGLADELFEALADRSLAADELLPATGVPPEVERWLSAAFIRSPDGRYGTRCSTLVLVERVNRRLVTHVIERSFEPEGLTALQSRTSLRDWPPGRGAEPVSGDPRDPIVHTRIEQALTTPLPAVAQRTRVRSLIRPPAEG